MIGQGVKNYFTNLKYFFTPLGTVALGLVFGLSVLIPGAIAAVGAFAEEVGNVIDGALVDVAALRDGLVSAVAALDWNSPSEAISTMFSVDWLTTTLRDCAGAFIIDAELHAAQLNAAALTCAHRLAGYVAIVVVFLYLGLVGGFLLVKWLIRRNIARRALWKYFLVVFLDSLLSSTLVAACVWLVSVWKPSALISTVIAVVVSGFVSLFEAYVVHGKGRVKFSRVVNAKNICELFATDIIIFVIAALLTGVASALTNEYVGLFIGVALMEIALVVIGLNAEAYVKSLSDGAVKPQIGAKQVKADALKPQVCAETLSDGREEQSGAENGRGQAEAK
ncbi:MAG: hypothetical protein ACI4MH_06680 [Candidatus Coproplasma sp.]